MSRAAFLTYCVVLMLVMGVTGIVSGEVYQVINVTDGGNHQVSRELEG
jgi:hypothetical protein